MDAQRKSIRVVAAVICRDRKIFATQRGYGPQKDWWEFPGGKIEPGETPEEALIREIREELDTQITVDGHLISVEYDYPDFHLSMECFWCSIVGGEVKLLEHEAARWLPVDDLYQVQWLPADIQVLEKIAEQKAPAATAAVHSTETAATAAVHSTETAAPAGACTASAPGAPEKELS